MNFNGLMQNGNTDQNVNSGGYPNGYPPTYSDPCEAYLNTQAIDDAYNEWHEKEMRLAPYRTKVEDMPDYVRNNFVGPRYKGMLPSYVDPNNHMNNMYGQQMMMGGYMQQPMYQQPPVYQQQMYQQPPQQQQQPSYEEQLKVLRANGIIVDDSDNDRITIPDQEFVNPGPYVPGRNGPIECTRHDGTVDYVNVNQPQPYDQVMMQQQPPMYNNPYGGYMQQPMYQQPMIGGYYEQQFMPAPQPPQGYVQGGTTYPLMQGFNQSFPGSTSTGNVYLDQLNGSGNPYTAYMRNPYTGRMELRNISGYMQTSCSLDDCFYGLDNAHFMEGLNPEMLLSAEDKARLDKERYREEAESILAFNYGTPNMYQYDTYRDELETIKRDECDLWSLLHRNAAHYAGKEYTEEMDQYVRQMHNPLRQMEAAIERRNQAMRANMVDYTRMSQTQMKDIQEDAKHREAIMASRMYDWSMNFEQPSKIAMANQIFGKIKATHDRLLGIQPGQHQSLSQYLDSAHELAREAFVRDKMILQRAKKFSAYDRNAFIKELYGKTRAGQEEAEKSYMPRNNNADGGVREEFLNIRPGFKKPNGEFSEIKLDMLKNMYARTGKTVLEDDQEEGYYTVNGYTFTNDPRIKRFKEGLGKENEKFDNMIAVNGDRRGKKRSEL